LARPDGFDTLDAVFTRVRRWLADRKQRRIAKYADAHGFMDRKELERLRRQQSPMRGGRGRRG
jgi:hypothetical protein